MRQAIWIQKANGAYQTSLGTRADTSFLKRITVSSTLDTINTEEAIMLIGESLYSFYNMLDML